jgi:hypothetical protein
MNEVAEVQKKEIETKSNPLNRASSFSKQAEANLSESKYGFNPKVGKRENQVYVNDNYNVSELLMGDKSSIPTTQFAHVSYFDSNLA